LASDRAEALAVIIRALPKFKTATSVLLMACDSGISDDIGKPLSKLLQLKVVAAKGYVYFNPRRIYTAEPNVSGAPGPYTTWRTFDERNSN
jgi:hypothetical protein